jgi:hypothetical protein
VHSRDPVPAKQFAVAVAEHVTNQRDPVADERQPFTGAEHVHQPGPESLGRTAPVCDAVRFGRPDRKP